MPYLLDANVFIGAKNLHYGFSFCPAFWDWLIRENSQGKVFSIEKVGDELQAIADDLSVWAAARGSNFFTRPSTKTFGALAQVSHWVSGQQYDPAAVSGFLQVADYYLVAQAFADSFAVVTHEIPSGSRKKVKIPDVCIGLGIKCVTPYQMLALEKARFVLAP